MTAHKVRSAERIAKKTLTLRLNLGRYPDFRVTLQSSDTGRIKSRDRGKILECGSFHQILRVSAKSGLHMTPESTVSPTCFYDEHWGQSCG
jgi:hypothetical protein